MRTTSRRLILLGACAAAGVLGEGTQEVKFDNPQTRVLAVTAAPHQPSAPQEHPMNRVLIFRTAGQMTITTGGKAEKMEFKAGEARWSPAGAPYVSENITDHPIEMVIVELKNKPKNPPLVLPPLDPIVSDADHYKVDFENEQVRVLRVRYGAHEKGEKHTHVRDRVVVNLSPELRQKYGDVRMTPGGDTHSEENASDLPVERLAVELK